jgi:rubrerythrin
MKRGVFGILVLAGVMALGMAGRLLAGPGTTAENLNAAYQMAANAESCYKAFAARADAEGCKSVAALFRAAGKSQNIHAAKCEAQIKKLGGTVTFKLEAAEVKSTRENLEAALKMQTAERSAQLAAFAAQAEAGKNVPAMYAFKGAMAAEAQLVKYFTQALGGMETWKAGDKDILVCLVCGYVTMDTATKNCPVCQAPRSKFEDFK